MPSKGRGAGRIDFAAINAAALGCLQSLLAEWLPDGHPVAGEWKALNPTRGDTREGSFSINIHSGVWADFASDDKGADPVSLYAYLFTNNDQGRAARELAERLGIGIPPPTGRPQRSAAKAGKGDTPAPDQRETPQKETRPRTHWVAQRQAPADAPELPRAHPIRGKPDAAWAYRDGEGRLLGAVYRFTTSSGGKEILPLCWARNDVSGREEWHWLGFADPRPMYRLDHLATLPDATVLIVEGEKCADAAAMQLLDLAAMSWPGGSKAVDKVDWSPIAGRKVIIWPDCDAQRERLSKDERLAGIDPQSKPLLPEAAQPGMKAALRIAAQLVELGCKVWLVQIPPPGDKPAGWDVADAVAEGLTGAALAEWLRANVRPYLHVIEGQLSPKNAPADAGKMVPDATQAGAGRGRKGGGEPPDDDEPKWQSRLLWKKGDLVACLANLFDILSNAEEWRGVLAYDEFAQRTVKLAPPPFPGGTAGEWDSNDDTQTAMWLTRFWSVTPSSALVAETIEALARANPVHPVREWLRSLPAWDQVPRLDAWITDFLGVEDSPYVRRVARYYLVSMVARVMKPGVKTDHCLVLEGVQGKGKSAAMAVLGGEWYGDTDLDLHNKDSMSALRGKWLYEFAELGSVARAESMKQKSFLSRQVDEYRPVYGRREIRVPRQVVFCGTTNDWEWNKDPTGGRRFWPVDCAGEIDLDGLRAMREQLFAEALLAFEAGERWWPTAQEQKELFDPQQLMREQPEGLVDALHDWVFAQVGLFSVYQAVNDGLKLDASKLTRDMQTRVGVALRKLGCSKVEKRNGMVRYWYKAPEKAPRSTSHTPAQHGTDDFNVPF